MYVCINSPISVFYSDQSWSCACRETTCQLGERLEHRVEPAVIAIAVTNLHSSCLENVEIILD